MQYESKVWATADALLKMSIKTVEDIKNFYIGINNLASEISSNQDFLVESGSVKYSDNIKLREAINHVFGYGIAVRKSKFFTKQLSKEVNLNAFLKKNPQAKFEIKIIEEKAQIYFYTLAEKVESLEKEGINKDKKIKELQRVVKSIQKELSGKEREDLFLITKSKDGDYYLNETSVPRLLKLKKTALYFLVLETMYLLVPEGGTIKFNDFIGRAPKKIKEKLKKKNNREKCRIIRSYLTDKSNGFLRASKIRESTFKGKSLIECDPVIGITFNNKK